MVQGRVFRWRRPKPTIDELLKTVTADIENLAEQIFLHVVSTDQKMPPRETIESAMKGFLRDFLAPARRQTIKAGKPQAEVEAYASVVTSHAQVAFQTKWAHLKRQHEELVRLSASDLVH